MLSVTKSKKWVKSSLIMSIVNTHVVKSKAGYPIYFFFESLKISLKKAHVTTYTLPLTICTVDSAVCTSALNFLLFSFLWSNLWDANSLL